MPIGNDMQIHRRLESELFSFHDANIRRDPGHLVGAFHAGRLLVLLTFSDCVGGERNL